MPERGAVVYMLQCADDSYYVGSTKGDNMASRLDQHQAGYGGAYTSTRRPVTLVWSQDFDDYNDAFAAERQLKGWTRAKKEALAAGDWDRVRAIAKKPRLKK